MARYKRNMSPSQRAKYNRYMRFRYLITQLELWKHGKRKSPPHPKKSDPKLLWLYKRYGAENKVVIPMEWMSKDQIKKVRNRERYQRSLRWQP